MSEVGFVFITRRFPRESHNDATYVIHVLRNGPMPKMTKKMGSKLNTRMARIGCDPAFVTMMFPMKQTPDGRFVRDKSLEPVIKMGTAALHGAH